MYSRKSRIPEATVQRLLVYLRYVSQLHRDGVQVVSSHALSRKCGFKAAQVRKDFAYFGELGVRGVGYYVKDLSVDLRRALGLSGVWEVAMVGAGHLGSALLNYSGFRDYGFVITAVFDRSPESLPEEIRTEHNVRPLEEFREVVRAKGIKIAIVAVPATAAQEVLNSLIESGIRAILNLAPVKLEGKPGVKIRNVDLAEDLGALTFFLTGTK